MTQINRFAPCPTCCGVWCRPVNEDSPIALKFSLNGLADNTPRDGGWNSRGIDDLNKEYAFEDIWIAPWFDGWKRCYASGDIGFMYPSDTSLQECEGNMAFTWLDGEIAGRTGNGVWLPHEYHSWPTATCPHRCTAGCTYEPPTEPGTFNGEEISVPCVGNLPIGGYCYWGEDANAWEDMGFFLRYVISLDRRKHERKLTFSLMVSGGTGHPIEAVAEWEYVETDTDEPFVAMDFDDQELDCVTDMPSEAPGDWSHVKVTVSGFIPE